MTFVMSIHAPWQCAEEGGRVWEDAMTPQAIEPVEQVGPVCHASTQVWCADRGQLAVVSVVGRNDAGPPIRFVLWCSLRACGECSERCLLAERSC
jgi:hypothetical protein